MFFINLPQILLTLCSMGVLAACEGESIQPPPPPPLEGTILSSSCEEYTLIEEVADGEGGSSIRETERSPQCDWNPPEAGTVVESSCEEYTLVEMIADGEYGTTERRTDRSPQCGWNPPEAGTVLESYCDGFVLIEVIADGEYGSTEEREEESEECGWTKPVMNVTVVKETGDRYDPVVINVDYRNAYGEPEGWGMIDVTTTVGRAERVAFDTIHIYGDGRTEEGMFTIGNFGEWLYRIEPEPICEVTKEPNGIKYDCEGNRVKRGQEMIYYGPLDDRTVEWELAVVLHERNPNGEPYGFIREIVDGENYTRWQNRIAKYNETFERSGVHVRIVLKYLYTGYYDGLNSLRDMVRGEDFDIALGFGITQEGTCGIAFGTQLFYDDSPVVGLSGCGWKTDLHEIGHAVGLAHGPENQDYPATGYIFPDFGHGWNDICDNNDDIMSYGNEDWTFSNSLQTCADQGFENLFYPDDPAGDRTYRDTAHAINRVRYRVADIHKENVVEVKSNIKQDRAKINFNDEIIVD